MTKANCITIFKKIKLMTLTLLGYCMVGIAFALFFLPAYILLLVLPANKRYDNRFLFWLLDKGFEVVLFGLFRKIKIQGLENLSCSPAIYVANHSSALDIPLVGRLMHGHPHIWYVLEYYSNTFLLGTFVRRLGIFVDKEKTHDAARSLIRGIRLVEGRDRHTIIFPEGGRFNDGTIHPFHEGFSVIAKKHSIP